MSFSKAISSGIATPQYTISTAIDAFQIERSRLSGCSTGPHIRSSLRRPPHRSDPSSMTQQRRQASTRPVGGLERGVP